MATQEVDVHGNALNRHALDGKTSPLLFFKSIGWPIYRLRVQLRMAEDLFKVCHREVYSDLPFEYAPFCNISQPQHAIGVQLEAYLKRRFNNLSPAPEGTLEPVFVHCNGSKSFRDHTTKSRKSSDQVKIALDLIKDFVVDTGVDASKIVFISPYKANVEQITRQRKLPEYSDLVNMPEAVTVDSIQGREGDISVIVMGTTKASGPGFTVDVQRLNVMLSRQCCGLLIVGDVHTPGNMGKGKSGKVHVVGDQGGLMFVGSKMLFNVHKALWAARRVVRVDVPVKEESGESAGKTGSNSLLL